MSIAAEDTIMTFDPTPFESRNDLIVTIEQVPIRDLRVDSGEEGYQRLIWQEAVDKIIRNFDPHLFDVITVSMRDDGSYWVIDGHHRVTAAKELGIGTIPARIIYGLSREEEASLFTKLARGRRNITPFDQLKADIAAGKEDAIGFKQVLRDNGFMPDYSSAHQPREMQDDCLFPVRAVRATRVIYDMDKGDTLGKVLTVVREAWGKSEPATALKISNVRALARLLSRCDDVDITRLVEVLRSISPTVLISRGQARASTLGVKVPVGIALEMLEMYNRSIRGRSTGRLPVDRVM